MTAILHKAALFWSDEQGGAAIEYGLMVVGFTLLVLMTAEFFGGAAADVNGDLAIALKSAEPKN